MDSLFRFSLFVFVSTICIGNSFSQNKPITLETALSYALKNDPTLTKVYADVIHADGYASEVRSEMRPQLRLETDGGYAMRERTINGLTTGGGYLLGHHSGVVVEKLLWDNGVSCHKWKDAKVRAKAARLLNQAQRETTAIATVDAFLRVWRNRKLVELAREDVAIHERFLETTTKRENGVGTAADVKLASSRLKLARVSVEESLFFLEEAESDFVRYVGFSPPHLLYPHVPNIRSIHNVDPKKNFHYQALVLECKAAHLGSAANCRTRAPKIFFRGTAGYGENSGGLKGPDEELSALVVVDWDIFDGKRRCGLQEQADGRIAREVGTGEEIELLLKRDIAATWADYTSARDRELTLYRYGRGLQGTINLYRRQFKLGTRPLLSVLDIEKEKISSEVKLLNSRFERDLNAYRLLFLGGKLITNTLGEELLVCEPKNVDLECPCDVPPIQSQCVDVETHPTLPLKSHPVEGVKSRPAVSGIRKTFSSSRPNVSLPKAHRDSIPRSNKRKVNGSSTELPVKKSKPGLGVALNRFFKKPSRSRALDK